MSPCTHAESTPRPFVIPLSSNFFCSSPRRFILNVSYVWREHVMAISKRLTQQLPKRYKIHKRFTMKLPCNKVRAAKSSVGATTCSGTDINHITPGRPGHYHKEPTFADNFCDESGLQFTLEDYLAKSLSEIHET